MNKTIAVIPARGGSKGISRKNIRLLHGAPLISYALRAASDALGREHVFVSTDDEAIASIARRLGARVIHRPEELARDAVTLDPVIAHAVEQVESLGMKFDLVATIQPTSPLMRSATIRTSVKRLRAESLDTILAVTEDRHLRWTQAGGGEPSPLFAERLNRQFLPMEYREAGALLLTRRKHITSSSRFGPRVGLIELMQDEAVDIDGYPDWWLADNYLSHRKIAVRVDGGGPLGLGHVYRQLTLLERLSNHEVRFFMDHGRPHGIELAAGRGVPTHTGHASELVHAIVEWSPDIVLVDKLDTERHEIETYKLGGAFVVTFEDLGPGSEAADMIFNALYADARADGHRVFCGPQVVCLREEFHVIPPKSTRPIVEHILLTFGGTDPNNLSEKALRAALRLGADVRITVVLGLGYAEPERIQRLVDSLGVSAQVNVVQNCASMSELMWEADFAVTSAGRTVFETLACYTPCIVMAQNERELRHTSADERHGVVNLGLGEAVSEDALTGAMREMLDFEKRSRAQGMILEMDLLDGPETILFSTFREFERRQRKSSRLRLLEWVGDPNPSSRFAPAGEVS